MKYKKVIVIILLACIGTIYKIHSKEQNVYEKYVVVIDPGHGGWDQGASREQIYEEDLNFQVALYLKQFLESQDVTVIMTRTSDVDLASPTSDNRKREDLKRRVELMNMGNLFVSIHMNIAESSVQGSQVFSSEKEESILLADTIQEELKKLNNSKFISKIGDYYILNESDTIGVIVECGFLSNSEERKQLQQPQYQEKLAYAICTGILEYEGKK